MASRLFFVDSKADGIKYEQLKTIAADKQCEVKFENVQVAPRACSARKARAGRSSSGR